MMKLQRLLAAALLGVALLGVSLLGVAPAARADNHNLVAALPVGNTLLLDVQGMSTATVTIPATYSGLSLQFEGSNDGGADLTPLNACSPGGVASTGAVAGAGVYLIPVGGFQQLWVNVAAISGAGTVVAHSSAGNAGAGCAPALPSTASTAAWQSYISGQLTNLLAQAINAGTLSSLSAQILSVLAPDNPSTGNQLALTSTANNIPVALVGGRNTATFVISSLTGSGATIVFEDTGDYTAGSPHWNTSTGIATPTVTTDGTYVVSSSGKNAIRARVSVAVGSGTATVSYLATNALNAVNLLNATVAAGSTTSGEGGSPVMGAVSTSAPSYSSGQTNFFSLDLNGGLRESLNQCPNTLNIYQTANSDVHTFTGYGYICNIVLMSSAGQNFGMEEGTGATCGTGTTPLVGMNSTTPEMPFPASGGLALGPRFPTKLHSSGDHLCLMQSTSSPIAGWITYNDLPN